MNPFAEKMKVKTDDELKIIIGSKDYVTQAREAAESELVFRGRNPNRQWQVKVRAQAEYDEKYQPRPYHKKRFLLFCIGLIIVSLFYSLPTLFVSKQNLFELQGDANFTQVLVETFQVNTRFGRTTESQRATLTFRLNGIDKNFQISENIGYQTKHEEYERMAEIIKEAQQVSVLIQRSRAWDSSPEVFQIKADTLLIYSISDAKKTTRIILFSGLGIGLMGLLLYLLKEKPQWFNNIFKIS